jgi:endonuclease/exonuclease/phosphatase family metal-dependent hydrolase
LRDAVRPSLFLVSMLKIVTLNILSDLSRWEKRRGLLVQEIERLSPHLVALQEVRLPQNTAQWLADQLGYTNIYLTPKMSFEADREAIAILSRLPFTARDSLSLGGQNRVAQYVQVEDEGQPVRLVNGHFFWQPGESAVRLQQVERLLAWLSEAPGDSPSIICGDFNSTPETQAIQRMRQDYVSAYAAVHGAEPEFTCPTPLPRSAWAEIRTLLGFFLLIRPRHLDLRWRGVLDYIFVDPRLRVLDCQVAFNKPAPDDPRIYPSDHLGLFAEVTW